MRFKYYQSQFIKVLFLALALQCNIQGQRYFSSILPLDNVPTDARSMAMGDGMNYYLNPASGHFDNTFSLHIDFDVRATTETRSFPVIDMFDDVVTENVYVVNRSMVYSVPWKIGADVTQWLKLPVSLFLSQSPVWDFRYNYKEEVRARLGPGVYNRDPVAGYHIFRTDGFIQSTQLNIAVRPVSVLSLGISMELLSENNLSQEMGVQVLRADDALAADSTNVTQYDLSVENATRWSAGLNYFPVRSISIDLSMKSAVDLSFETDGYVPVLDERTQLPGLTLADTSSTYSISLPNEYRIGFTARLTNQIKTIATGNVTYADWSQYDEVIVNSATADTVNFHYQPAWTIHLGVEHWILNKTPFRFGFMYLGSPLGENNEQTIITVGTGWSFEHFTFDVGVAFGSTEYRYTDLFVPAGQEAAELELVKESTLAVKASLTYSF